MTSQQLPFCERDNAYRTLLYTNFTKTKIMTLDDMKILLGNRINEKVEG